MIFLREWNGGIAAGGFEPKAKPIFQKGIPDKFEFQLLPEDWDHFRKWQHFVTQKQISKLLILIAMAAWKKL